MFLINKLKSKTAKDSFLTLAANLVSQMVSFLVVIILGRFFSVAEYGVYSILNNIASFVQDMADMGMNGAITRFIAEFRGKGEKERELQLICYAVRRKLINLAIVFVVLVLLAKPIASLWLQDQEKYLYIYIIIITCAFSLFVSALRSVLQGRQEFKAYFISVVLWNVIWAGVILGFIVFDKLTVASSLISGIISGGINLILCIKLVNLDVNYVIKKNNIEKDVKKKFNSFGNWMMLWALFAILQSKIDVFMLASFTSSEQVSYYDIATKVIKPILMAVSAYAQVLNPQFASMDRSLLKERIKAVIKFIGLVSIVIVISMIVVGPLINLAFGKKYDNSIIPAQMLLFAIIFYVWTVPFNSVLYALNKPYVFTLAAFIGLVVTALGDYLLLGEYGAIGAAFTYIVAQIVGLVVAFVAYIIIVKMGKKGEM